MAIVNGKVLGNSAAPLRGRQKASVLHAQGDKDMGFSVFVHPHAGEPLNEFPEHDEIYVAVQELGPRRMLQFFLMRATKSLLFPLPGNIQIQVTPESGI